MNKNVRITWSATWILLRGGLYPKEILFLKNVPFGQRAEKTGVIHEYHKQGCGAKSAAAGQFLVIYLKKYSHFSAIQLNFCIFLEPFKRMDC